MLQQQRHTWGPTYNEFRQYTTACVYRALCTCIHSQWQEWKNRKTKTHNRQMGAKLYATHLCQGKSWDGRTRLGCVYFWLEFSHLRSAQSRQYNRSHAFGASQNPGHWCSSLLSWRKKTHKNLNMMWRNKGEYGITGKKKMIQMIMLKAIELDIPHLIIFLCVGADWNPRHAKFLSWWGIYKRSESCDE